MSKRKMKDSGVEWLGEIPAEWDVRRGKTFLRLLSRPVKVDDDIVTCFRDGEVTLRKNRREDGFTVALKECGYQGVEPGDLVVHGMDGFAGSIGISDSRGKASPVLNVMDTSEDKRYIMYYLRSLAMRDVFLALSTGIRVRSCDLRWSKLGDIQYLLPPLFTQRKIAAYLDGRCAKIDEMISGAKKTIEEYKAWKSSVIFETVTGKNIIGKKKSSGVEWMGDIPASWSLTPLKYLISDYKAGPFGSSLITANLLPAGEILVYTPEHIAKRGTSLENNLYLPVSRREEMSQFIVRPGDVIFPIVGSLGRAMLLGPNNPMGIINQRLAKFRLNPKVVDDRYFMRLFGESDFYGQHLEVCCRGTIIVNLTKSIVGAMPFPLPPLGVQREIAHQLDAQCLVVERVIAEKEKMIADLESYKKSLIFECVTGKMEVA